MNICRILLLSTSFILVAVGCTNKGNAPGGTALNLPEITGSVNGASFLSLEPMATTGAPLNAESCSLCGSNTPFLNVFSQASIFVFQGKFADANSCTMSAFAEADAIPNLTSGEYKYLNSGDVKTKLKITAEGTSITSFEFFTCQNGSQVQYVSGTNSAGDVTFTFRSGTPGSLFVSMDAEGTMSGTQWLSKTLDVGFYSSTSGSYIFSRITQTSNYLDVEGVLDNGTLGTLDGSDVRIFSRTQLLGDSLQTYALGDGSIRLAVGTNSATTDNWNGDTGVHSAGPTTFDSVVASATLPSVPTTRSTAFTSSEQWDCQSEGEEISLMSIAASNPSLLAKAQVCEESFK